MRNSKDDIDQCFIATKIQEFRYKQAQQHFEIKINHFMQQQMPANQLRTVRRPSNMLSRTLFKQIIFNLLPQQLQQKGIEIIQEIIPKKINCKLSKKQQLSMAQYFSQNIFTCIYHKYGQRNNLKQTLSQKIKCIESLCDYNWKLFKQLNYQDKNTINLDKFKIDSNFQCGNLCRAYTNKQQPNNIYLILENDVNTHGFNNWFFFRVRGAPIGQMRFHIVNITKNNSMFKQGMLISIFSMKRYQKEKIGWFKGGEGLNLYQTGFERSNHQNDYFLSLSFQYNFRQSNDQVYFALNKPYTYTRLIRFLSEYQNNSQVNIEIKNVGYTISNNLIPSIKLGLGQNISQRKAIIFLARQHPSQTMGSYIAQGIMNYFKANQFDANYLLNKYQIIIIPMVNPDGVIHGNSRCNFSGLDLNRHWGQNTIKELTPQTYRLRMYIMDIVKATGVSFLIDLHGHGKKLNSFIFACKSQDKINNRLFSYALSRIEPRFSLLSCTYGLTRDKQNTIRSQFYKAGVNHCYTLQNSFYGYCSDKQIIHYNQNDFNQIGKSIITSIYTLLSDNQIALEKLGYNKDIISIQLSNMIDYLEKQQKLGKNDDQIQSDSDPQGDILNIEERMVVCKNINKNFKKKVKDICSYRVNIQKLKKSKRSMIKSGNKLTMPQDLDIRNSCPNQQQKKHSSQQKQLSHRLSQQNKKITKISTVNKKIAHKRKWKDRTFTQFPQTLKDKTRNFLPVKSPIHPAPFIPDKNQRSKMCTSVIYQYPRQLPKKTSQQHSKVKTQACDLTSNIITQQSQTHDIKKIKAPKPDQSFKYKVLRQQSLKALLTDSLSIFKIDPNKKSTSKFISQKKTNLKDDLRSQSQNTKFKSYSRLQASVRHYTQYKNHVQKKSKKYKRFQNFVQQQKPQKNTQKGIGSVFYYFPIL